MNLSFRFRQGSSNLDNKAIRDLDRLLGTMAAPKFQDYGLLLIGFADALGGETANMKISMERAGVVARELGVRGVQAELVKGFGSALPVATNSTQLGRDKNRRVEVWLRKRDTR